MDVRSAWQRSLPPVLLIAQPLVFFRSVVFANTRYIPFDIGAWHLPLAAFIARCVRDRVMPFWDPYSNCGTAIWADIQAQLFYPITWVVLLIGNLTQGRQLFYWLETLIPLHMILGGIFTFILVRRLGCSVPAALFAGTTYQLGAFFASQAQHLGAICAGAWFPLLLLCVHELGQRISARSIGLTAIAVALEILSGFPAAAAVAFVSAGIVAISLALLGLSRWRSVPAFLAGIGLGACISAVQLIPTAQASSWTVAKLRGDWHALGGGLPLQSLASFFWPNYYHVFTPSDPALYRLPLNFTLMYTYCGHLAALCLLLAPLVLLYRRTWREHRLLLLSLAFTFLSAVWMIGESTPIYTNVYLLLPKMIRGSLYSEYALMAFTLGVAATAALTIHALWPKSSALAWLLAVAAGVNLIAVSSNRAMNTARGGYQTMNSEYTYNGDPGPIRELQRLTGSATPPPRIDFLDPVFWPFNTGAEMYRVPSAMGDSPLMNLRYYYFRRVFSGAPFFERIQFVTDVNSRWIDAINDGLLIAVPAAKPPVLPPERYEPVTLGGLRVWRNKSALPRFHLVDRVRHADSMDQARALLSSVTDPYMEAIVENLPSEWRGSGSSGSSVQVVAYTNNRIELDVHTTGPSYLVTSEAFYPGWTATLNHKPVTLLPTNLAFRGLPVPPGDSRIGMNFRPDYLALSVVISIAGLAVTVGFLARPMTP